MAIGSVKNPPIAKPVETAAARPAEAKPTTAKAGTTAPAAVDAFEARSTGPNADARQRMDAAGYYKLDPKADRATADAAARAWTALEKLAGPLPPSPHGSPRTLGNADREALEALAAQLEGYPAAGARDENLLNTLRDDWLVGHLSPAQVAGRFEIGAGTGYLLVDQGPNPTKRDDVGWSDRDVAQAKDVFLKLPDQLKHLPVLRYITRDARSPDEATILDQLDQRVASEPNKLKAALGRALVNLLDGTKMGSVFGQAFGPELRLYGELFAGSQLPGLGGMRSYVIVHELGHEQLFYDSQRYADWKDFYEKTGQSEAFNGYARGSIQEGYGVALGTYAVDPEMLKKKAPQTYEFLHERFGDSLKCFNSNGLEGKAIEAVYGFSDVLAKILGSPS